MDGSARSSVSSVQYPEPSFSGSEIVLQILCDPGRDTEENPHLWPQSGCLWNRLIQSSGPRSSLLPNFSEGVQGWRWGQGLEGLPPGGEVALGWDPGLGLLGGASGGGGFFGARNPEPPRNFGWNCISLGRAGVIPGRRLRTHKLCSVGSSSCSRYSAPWPGSLCLASRRVSGIGDPGTPQDGEVGMREELETEIPVEGEGRKGDGDRR